MTRLKQFSAMNKLKKMALRVSIQDENWGLGFKPTEEHLPRDGSRTRGTTFAPRTPPTPNPCHLKP